MARIVSIEIDNKNIKIIEGSRFFNSVKIYKAIILECPENSIIDGKIINMDSFVEAISDAMQKNNINSKRATIIFNNDNIILRSLELPKLNNSETSNLINNELEQLINYNLESYKILHVKSKKTTSQLKKQYIIYGIPKELYNQYMELSKNLNLELDHLDLGFRVLDKIYSKKLKLNNKEFIDKALSTAFVDISYYTITFTVINSDVVEFSRTYKSGIKDLINNYCTILSLDEQSALREINNIGINQDIKISVLKQNIIEEYIAQLTDDFNRYIRYYNSNNKDKTINNMFIYGTFSNIKGLDKFIENRLNLSTHFVEKLSGFYIDKKIHKAFDYETYLCGAMSLYLQNKDLDFLAENKKKHNKNFKIKSTFYSFALSLILIILYFLYSYSSERYVLNHNISNIEGYLSNEQNIRLNEKALSIQKNVQILEQYKKDANSIKDIIKHDDVVKSNLIADVILAMPSGVEISSISINKEKLVISSSAPSLTHVAYFERNLKQLNFIQSVKIPSTVEIDGGYNYSIECSLKDVSDYELE